MSVQPQLHSLRLNRHRSPPHSLFYFQLPCRLGSLPLLPHPSLLPSPVHFPPASRQLAPHHNLRLSRPQIPRRSLFRILLRRRPHSLHQCRRRSPHANLRLNRPRLLPRNPRASPLDSLRIVHPPNPLSSRLVAQRVLLQLSPALHPRTAPPHPPPRCLQHSRQGYLALNLHLRLYPALPLGLHLPRAASRALNHLLDLLLFLQLFHPDSHRLSPVQSQLRSPLRGQHLLLRLALRPHQRLPLRLSPH